MGTLGTVYPIPSMGGHLGRAHLLAIVSRAAVSIIEQVFVCLLSILLRKNLGVDLLDLSLASQRQGPRELQQVAFPEHVLCARAQSPVLFQLVFVTTQEWRLGWGGLLWCTPVPQV